MRTPRHNRTLAERVGRQVLAGKPVSFELDDADDMVILAESYGDPANRDVYKPRPSQKVPKTGAWVMIKRTLPPMEKDLHTVITVGRVFYAEHGSNADEQGFLPDGKYLVDVRTAFGDLKLWPYEYMTLETEAVIGMWQAGELTFHPTEISEHQLNDTVFYARSRGIGLADAMVIALGSINAPVGWFEPHPDLLPEIEALCRFGGPLTEVNHQRRAAAKARKRAEEANA